MPYKHDIVCFTNESFTQTINSNTTFQLTGDTEICEGECINISPDQVLDNLRKSSKNKNLVSSIKLQFQNENKLIVINKVS